jgi:hypothetical protein
MNLSHTLSRMLMLAGVVLGGCSSAAAPVPARAPVLTSAPAPGPAATAQATPAPAVQTVVAVPTRVHPPTYDGASSSPTPTRFHIANESDMNAAARASQASQQALQQSLQ